MAYVAFDEAGGAVLAPWPSPASTGAGPVIAANFELTALEWSVVKIARADGLSSLRPPGRLSNALRAVFKRPNPRLANERLEALRRMAVLTWRNGYAVPSREVRALIDAGFTLGQYENMVDRVGAARFSPPRTARS